MCRFFKFFLTEAFRQSAVPIMRNESTCPCRTVVTKGDSRKVVAAIRIKLPAYEPVSMGRIR